MIRKKTFSIVILLTCYITLFSQEKVKKQEIYSWNISEDIGEITYQAIKDTSIFNFHQSSTEHQISIANAYNGNLGSPLESKIYFQRTKKHLFLFATPYAEYLSNIENFSFYNTTTPYSNVTYYTAGPSYRKEERLKGFFTVNANPYLNFGFVTDFIYAKGIYQNQAANHFTNRIWASYIKNRYSFHSIASFNQFKNQENGGIKNSSHITNPQEFNHGRGNLKPQDIEVNLYSGTKSQFKNRYLYFNQNYHLKKDSNLQEISLIHTAKLSFDTHNYIENTIPSHFYNKNTFLDSISTNDTANMVYLKNNLGISFLHKKSKYTAYLSHEIDQRRFLQNSILNSKTLQSSALNALFNNQIGKINTKLQTNFYFAGYKAKDFLISGKIDYFHSFFKENFNFSLLGAIESNTPDFFLQTYESNHFIWNNQFDKETKSKITGLIHAEKIKANVKINAESLNKYIYFNNKSLPEQATSQIQLFSVDLQKDFTLKNFVLENSLIYQHSNSSKLPLPTWSVYQNIYYKGVLFKVLNFQLGADMHIHSQYHAPIYIPATGQFKIQEDKLIGNYPLINIYGNFHLKQVRFFLMCYHCNYTLTEKKYFSMPSYPLNPRMFKIGISWNFYN